MFSELRREGLDNDSKMFDSKSFWTIQTLFGLASHGNGIFPMGGRASTIDFAIEEHADK